MYDDRNKIRRNDKSKTISIFNFDICNFNIVHSVKNIFKNLKKYFKNAVYSVLLLHLHFRPKFNNSGILRDEIEIVVELCGSTQIKNNATKNNYFFF